MSADQEIGHVVARQSEKQIAKSQLTQGLSRAAAVATYDPHNPSSASAAAAATVGRLMNLKCGRDDELESDVLSASFVAAAGYDQRSSIRVMVVLSQGSSGRGPEFFQTLPNPKNRVARMDKPSQQPSLSVSLKGSAVVSFCTLFRKTAQI
ncbi:M48 family metalloprotease [Rufibacter tibetensis]|uniref:M48 family metalloprotease n=1 Tax=Rufibacter tibetensis TaxID=512763 RepID=UPI0014700A41|nr:M48 family metalloprotease [Rufibacter tibetensis]